MNSTSICGMIVVAYIALATNFLNAQDKSASNDATKKSIGKLLQTQVDCWNKEDLEGFMQTYWKSEKLTFSAGGQTTRGWQQTFDRYKKRYQTGDAEMGKLRFDNLEIEMLGDDSCFVLGRWHLKMSNENPEGNFSLVMKKMKGEWKIIHDHSSSLEKDKDD